MREELSVVCECALPSHFNVKVIITENGNSLLFLSYFLKSQQQQEKKNQSNDHCVKINFLI